MLQAIRITEQVGPWLDAAASGHVHSVFHRVCNLAWGDWLIPLHTADTGRLPGGVLVHGDVDFTRLGLRPGAPAAWKPDQQCLYAGHHPVSLGRAATVPASATALVEPTPAVLAERCVQLTNLVRRHGRGTVGTYLATAGLPIKDAVAEAVWARGRRLCESLLEGDDRAIRRNLESILGLGAGLTPAGDDFVMGLMATVTYARRTLGPMQAKGARLLLESVSSLAPRLTTQISSHYLRLGAMGAFSERLEKAALRLLDGAVGEELEPAVVRLLESGHSSGTDTAVGLYFGMQVLSGRLQ